MAVLDPLTDVSTLAPCVAAAAARSQADVAANNVDTTPVGSPVGGGGIKHKMVGLDYFDGGNTGEEGGNGWGNTRAGPNISGIPAVFHSNTK